MSPGIGSRGGPDAGGRDGGPDAGGPDVGRPDFYGFVAGKPAVEPFEVEELGPLGGMRLAHLRCHFGLDTLDLARLHPGLTVVGLDFSTPAIEAASSLAKRVGLARQASFVVAEVESAVLVLGAGEFDVVYTGKGALSWSNDLDSWAATCFALLRPGGFLYLSEFHPVGSALSLSSPAISGDYFRRDPWLNEDPGTHTESDTPTEHNPSARWNHPLSSILSAVIGAGFDMRFFHEYDYTLYRMNDWLVPDAQGRYRWPAGGGKLPLMYSLKAYKSAGPADRLVR